MEDTTQNLKFNLKHPTFTTLLNCYNDEYHAFHDTFSFRSIHLMLERRVANVSNTSKLLDLQRKPEA